MHPDYRNGLVKLLADTDQQIADLTATIEAANIALPDYLESHRRSDCRRGGNHCGCLALPEPSQEIGRPLRVGFRPDTLIPALAAAQTKSPGRPQGVGGRHLPRLH
jgi:hypothetical protein